jgi:hypothetical protein
MTLSEIKATVLQHVSSDWVRNHFGDLRRRETWESARERCSEFISAAVDASEPIAGRTVVQAVIEVPAQERSSLTSQWVIRQRLCSCLNLFFSFAHRNPGFKTRFLEFREIDLNLKALSRVTPDCALPTFTLVREVVAIGAFCGKEARRPQTPAESARNLTFITSCDLALQAYEEYASSRPDPVLCSARAS